MKTIEELRKLDIGKLLEELTLIQKASFKLTFEVRSGQTKDSHMISMNKKQIARIKTILKQKENEKSVEKIEENN